MTKIQWDQTGEHLFESGLRHGVLYKATGEGVAWNGLISVEESTSASVEPAYFDALKFEDIITIDQFAGRLKAFTYPDEFVENVGIHEVDQGLFVHDQNQPRFHLSYQTGIGNEIGQRAYKIHLLYNLTAIPNPIEYVTLSDSSDVTEFEWNITAIPERIEGYQPSAHFVMDARKIDPWLLKDIEDILYGSDSKDAYLPPMQGFVSFIKKWDRIIIEDHGDGTWSAIAARDEQIVMVSETEFEIPEANAVYLDENTYEISSSPANEEDIWPL